MTHNISWSTKERSEFRGSLCELHTTRPSLHRNVQMAAWKVGCFHRVYCGDHGSERTFPL